MSLLCLSVRSSEAAVSPDRFRGRVADDHGGTLILLNTLGWVDDNLCRPIGVGNAAAVRPFGEVNVVENWIATLTLQSLCSA